MQQHYQHNHQQNLRKMGERKLVLFGGARLVHPFTNHGTAADQSLLLVPGRQTTGRRAMIGFEAESLRYVARYLAVHTSSWF